MVERAEIAEAVLEETLGILDDRLLVRRKRSKTFLSEGGARVAARASSALLGADGSDVGDVRVVVAVPMSEGDHVRVNFRWRRSAYGFWFSKTEDLGPLLSAEDADMTGAEMIATMIGWAAHGSVQLKSMNRVIPKVRASGWWA